MGAVRSFVVHLILFAFALYLVGSNGFEKAALNRFRTCFIPPIWMDLRFYTHGCIGTGAFCCFIADGNEKWITRLDDVFDDD